MVYYTVTHETNAGPKDMKVEITTDDISLPEMEEKARAAAVAQGVAPETITAVKLGWAMSVEPMPEIDEEIKRMVALRKEAGLKHVVLSIPGLEREDLHEKVSDGPVTVKASPFKDFPVGSDKGTTLLDILRGLDATLAVCPDDHAFVETVAVVGNTAHVFMGS